MEMDAERAIADLWGRSHEELHDIAHQLEAYLGSFCHRLAFDGEARGAFDFRFRAIDNARVKPFSSVLRHITDPADLWDIDDLVGARVVVITRSDVEILVNKLREDATDGQLLVEGFERYDLDEESGYQAVHLKGRLRRRDGGTVGYEIQIRTALLDLWAFLSRHDIYLREDLPDSLSSRARDEARHLRTVEDILQEIREEARGTPAPKTLTVGPESEKPQLASES